MATDGFLDNYLPYLLRRADQALSAAFYDVLTHHGVARSEWRVLAVLEELGELSIRELTVASLSPQPTVTHAVRRLEERKLVSRVTGADDKRQRFVSITLAGQKLTSTLIDEAKRLESVSLSEAGNLTRLMKQLKDLTRIVEANTQLSLDEKVEAR